MKKIFVLMAVGVLILGFSGTSARANPLVVFTEYSSTVLTATEWVGGPAIGTVINKGSDVWEWTPPVPTLLLSYADSTTFWQEPGSSTLGNGLAGFYVNSTNPDNFGFRIISDLDLTGFQTSFVADGAIQKGKLIVFDNRVDPAVVTATYDAQFIDLGDAPATVPEPCTMLLLGSGLAGLVGLRKRFKKA